MNKFNIQLLYFVFIHFSSSRLGRKAIEVCNEKWHTHPELASGIRTKPCAGKIFIQHPGRVGARA